MKFSTSYETYQPVDEALKEVRIVVEPLLRLLLEGIGRGPTDIEIRYVPIIMPKEMLFKYTSRSKARPKVRILDCAPQLDYQLFLVESFEQRVDAYLNGLRSVSPLLSKFGLSNRECAEYEEALLEAGRVATSNLS